MTPRVFLLLGVALILLAAPSAASFVQSSVSFTPDPPFVPGGRQEVTATCVIVPYGATTFPPGHTIQIRTGLLDPAWTIQVITDGRNAARQTSSKSTVFLNGALLAYPTTQDVSFTVTVSGTVPQDAGGQVQVLVMEELDNAGTVVPGSALVVSQPVAARSIAPAAIPALPSRATPETMPPASSPRSPFPAILCLIAAGCGLVLAARRR